MTDKPRSGPPPYATFSSLLSFLNKLRDTQIPSRIDPTVFGNASGSLSYSIIATLKFLKLIDADGTPSELFTKLVRAGDDERKAVMSALIFDSYPTFFSGTINVARATAGQLDDHIRQTYDASGSTVDKIAAFFIAAAQYAGIVLSPHIKARKPTYASASANKSKKQRKAVEDQIDDDSPPYVPPVEAKALEYQLIDLMKTEGIADEETAAIWTLVRFLTKKKAAV